MIIVAILFWWNRSKFLHWLFQRLCASMSHIEGILYQLTLELDPRAQQLYLHHQLQEWVELCTITLLLTAACQVLSWPYTAPGVFAGIYVSLRILSYVQRIRFNQTLLIERLNDFMYYYELSLMRGNHQIKALESANEHARVVDFTHQVSEYIQNFQKMYTHMKWVVIKKMTLLIERNQQFSSDHLSLEFMEISTELYERFVKGRRLSLERKENAMLIPMFLNMLWMIMYIVAPFLYNFIRR